MTDEFDVPSDGILGKDFLKRYRCGICLDNYSLFIRAHNDTLKVPILEGPDEDTIVLPARCESVRSFNISVDEECVIPNQEVAPGIFIPNTIVDSRNQLIRIMNTNSVLKTISKNIKLKVEPLKNYSMYNTQSNKNQNNPKKSRTNELLELIAGSVSSEVNLENKTELLNLINNFRDIFHMDNDKMTVNNFTNKNYELLTKHLYIEKIIGYPSRKKMR